MNKPEIERLIALVESVRKDIDTLKTEVLQLQLRKEKLTEALRAITRHQTPMGSSFNQWHQEIMQIAFKALAND
jgi:prefoldin subunit 5